MRVQGTPSTEAGRAGGMVGLLVFLHTILLRRAMYGVPTGTLRYAQNNKQDEGNIKPERTI